MKNTILKPNATPIYSFLSFIEAQQILPEFGKQLKILDCGAGGPVPPLALFNEHGFDTYGIDISDQQLKQAKQYSKKQGIQIDFRKADMRQIPFDDESFDCVYEHYAMCHLSKKDTTIAIGEMYRVTRHEGFCFLGLISMDSWPKSFFGEERSPGEFWTVENDSQEQHSMFTDEEAHFLVEDWDILSKEKRVIYLRKAAEQISETEWMGLFKDMKSTYTENVWLEKYNQRMNMINYTHIYYILRKR